MGALGYLVRSEIEGLIESLLDQEGEGPDLGDPRESSARIAQLVSQRFAVPMDIASGLVRKQLAARGTEPDARSLPGKRSVISTFEDGGLPQDASLPGKQSITELLDRQKQSRERFAIQSVGDLEALIRGPLATQKAIAPPSADRAELFSHRMRELLEHGGASRRDIILLGAAAAAEPGLLDRTLANLRSGRVIGGLDGASALEAASGGAIRGLAGGLWDGGADPRRRDRRAPESLGAQFAGLGRNEDGHDIGAELEDIEFAARVQMAEWSGALDAGARRFGRRARNLGRAALGASELVKFARPHYRAADRATGGELGSLVSRASAGISNFVDAPVGAQLPRTTPLIVARRGEVPFEDQALAELEESLAGGTGEPLPPQLQRRMSALLGHDFSHVRIHTSGRAESSADSIGARAFTVGSHIYFNAGEWAPGSLAFERLLIHELTHVIQGDRGALRGGERARVTDPDESVEREARAAESLAGTSVKPGGTTDGDPARETRRGWQPFAEPIGRKHDAGPGELPKNENRPGGEAPVVARGWFGDWVADKAASIIRRISPGMADLISKGPGELIKKALGKAVSMMAAPIRAGFAGISSLIGTLKSSFAKAFGFIKGLLNGDPQCCTAVTDFISNIRKAASAVANNTAVKTVGAAFAKAGSTFTSVASLVMDPAFDAIKKVAGGAWDGLKAVATTIGGWISTIKGYAERAWNWVAGKLGFGGGEGGVWNWLVGKAKGVWGEISSTLKPLAGPAKVVVGGLSMFTGLPQIYALVKYGPKVVEAVQWLWANKGDPKLAAKAREKYGDTLGTVLDSVQGFGSAMGSAADWLVGTAKKLSKGLLDLGSKVTGVPLLSVASGAINSVKETVSGVADWGTSVFKAAVTDVKAGAKKFAGIIKPYASVLSSIGMAILNPTMIPVILAGWAWQALPDCIKAPIIDLLLDAAIGVLRRLPNLLMFGPLWPILKTGVLGFLEGLRAQPPAAKEKASNKLAKIISGGSPAFIFGFVKGFLKGVWEGITDPFKLIYMAVKGLGSLAAWFGGIANQAMGGDQPAEETQQETQAAPGAAPPAPAAADSRPTRADLGARVGEMGREIGPPIATAGANAMPAAKAAFSGGGGKGGTSFSGLMAKMGSLWGSMEAAIRSGAAGLAKKACDFLLTDGAEGAMGEGVGWLAGTIAFEVILAILTAGAWAPVSAAAKALKVFARILDWTGAALGAAFKALAKVGRLIKRALGGLRRALASAGGAAKKLLGALGEIADKLVKFASELIGRFGRGVRGGGTTAAREGTQVAAREATEVATERGAREGAEVVSERSAREGADDVAETSARETAEETGDRSAREATEDAGEQGKRGDDMPDASEKMRVAGEARVIAQGLGLTGTPTAGIATSLKASFMPRYKWIKDFRPESDDVYMIASKIKVYTETSETRQWAQEQANSNPNKMTPEQQAQDLADFTGRRQEVELLYEAAKKDPSLLPSGVTMEQLELAVKGDPLTGQRVPLNFSVQGGKLSDDVAEARRLFGEFQGELDALLRSEGITDAKVVQLGSGTTGWSSAPGKTGKAWSPSSDVDFAIFSDEALDQARRTGAAINPKNTQAGQFTTIKNSSGFQDSSLRQKLDALEQKWNEKIYGSTDVDGFDFKLNLQSDDPFRSAVSVVDQRRVLGESLGLSDDALAKAIKDVGGVAELRRLQDELGADGVRRHLDELAATQRAAKDAAARQSSEEVGERAAREGAQETGDKASREAAEEAGEQGKHADEGAEQGKRADDTPDPAEKARVEVEVRAAARAMGATGMDPIAVCASLKATYMPRYKWIKDFTIEGSDVFMIASKKKIYSAPDVAEARQWAKELAESNPNKMTPDEIAADRQAFHLKRSILRSRFRPDPTVAQCFVELLFNLLNARFEDRWNSIIYGDDAIAKEVAEKGEFDGFDFKLNTESDNPFKSAIPVTKPTVVPLTPIQDGATQVKVLAGRDPYFGVPVRDPRVELPPGTMGRREFHITVLSPPELAGLTKAQREGILAGKNIPGTPTPGEIIKKPIGDTDAFQLEISWPEAQAFRESLGLPTKEFHVSLSGGVADAIKRRDAGG